MHRSEILCVFDVKKEKYILRAIRKGVSRGSIVEHADNFFSMNWRYINMHVEQAAAD
jgi:acyl CoA:acetate/3-ketoacid CoA transferase beta subunit